MSSDLKEMMVLLSLLLTCVGGLAYCHHDKELTERECLKAHSARECKP